MTLSSDVSVESLYDLTNKDSYQALYLSVILQAILDYVSLKLKEKLVK